MFLYYAVIIIIIARKSAYVGQRMMARMSRIDRTNSVALKKNYRKLHFNDLNEQRDTSMQKGRN